MSALQCLLKSAGIAGAQGGSNLFKSFVNGNLANVARVAMNMSAAQYNEEEVMRVVTALYLSPAKQDAREAWMVLDRRRTGAMRRTVLRSDAHRRSTAVRLRRSPARAQVCRHISAQPI